MFPSLLSSIIKVSRFLVLRYALDTSSSETELIPATNTTSYRLDKDLFDFPLERSFLSRLKSLID